MSREVVTVESLNEQIERVREIIRDRQRRIDDCELDYTDCFLSARCDADQINELKRQIKIVENGGTAWFTEYATLDNQLVDARWVDTKYGRSLVANMPNGETVWTSARTQKGLSKKGLKMVRVKRAAWCKYEYGCCVGVSYLVNYPAKWNRATGEDAPAEPLEVEWDSDFFEK